MDVFGFVAACKICQYHVGCLPSNLSRGVLFFNVESYLSLTYRLTSPPPGKPRPDIYIFLSHLVLETEKLFSFESMLLFALQEIVSTGKDSLALLFFFFSFSFSFFLLDRKLVCCTE